MDQRDCKWTIYTSLIQKKKDQKIAFGTLVNQFFGIAMMEPKLKAKQS